MLLKLSYRNNPAVYKRFWADISDRYIFWTLQVVLWFMFDVTKVNGVSVDPQHLRVLRKKLFQQFPVSVFIGDAAFFVEIFQKDKRLLVFFQHLVLTQFFYFPCKLTQRYLRRVAKMVCKQYSSDCVTAAWLISFGDAEIVLLIRKLIWNHWFYDAQTSCLPPKRAAEVILARYYFRNFKFLIPTVVQKLFNGDVAKMFILDCCDFLDYLILGRWVNDKSQIYYFQCCIATEVPLLGQLYKKILDVCLHDSESQVATVEDMYLTKRLSPVVGHLLLAQHYGYSFQQTKSLVQPLIKNLKSDTPQIDNYIRQYAQQLLHPVILNLLRYWLKHHKKI